MFLNVASAGRRGTNYAALTADSRDQLDSRIRHHHRGNMAHEIIESADQPRTAFWSDRLRRSLRPLFDMFMDVGLPMNLFYLLRLIGASQWSALLAATVIAGARVGWVALRSRRVSWFAALMMMVYGLGSALAIFTGDPRLLLANNSLSSAIVGIAFLASLVLDRPLTLIAYQSWHAGDADAWSVAYSSAPEVKRVFRRSAWAWGVGMLAAGALRLPLIYLLPLDIAVAASVVPGVVIMGGLSAWSIASQRSLTATRGTYPEAKTADQREESAAVGTSPRPT